MADLFCCWEKHLVFQSCVPYVRFLCLKKIIIIISISLQVSGILNKKIGTVSLLWAMCFLSFLIGHVLILLFWNSTSENDRHFARVHFIQLISIFFFLLMIYLLASHLARWTICPNESGKNQGRFSYCSFLSNKTKNERFFQIEKTRATNQVRYALSSSIFIEIWIFFSAKPLLQMDNVSMMKISPGVSDNQWWSWWWFNQN